MRDRTLVSMITVVIAGAALSGGISVSITWAQAPVTSTTAPALKTPWGDPDLVGCAGGAWKRLAFAQGRGSRSGNQGQRKGS